MTQTTEKPAHPEWAWWWSTDEERYHGPCASRGAAIMDAWAQDNHGTVYLCQATEGRLNTDLFDVDRLTETFDDANEDRGDPDGDPPSECVKADAWAKLVEQLNHRVAVFIREQGLKAWAFDGMENQQVIDLSEPTLNALPKDAREILADLATGWASSMPYSPSYFELRIKELAEALGVKESAESAP